MRALSFWWTGGSESAGLASIVESLPACGNIILYCALSLSYPVLDLQP